MAALYHGHTALTFSFNFDFPLFGFYGKFNCVICLGCTMAWGFGGSWGGITHDPQSAMTTKVKRRARFMGSYTEDMSSLTIFVI